MTEPFVLRLIDEMEKLHRKLADLNRFTGTPIYAGLSEPEKRLLRRQRDAMTDYVRILKERIQFYGELVQEGRP